MIKGNVLRDAIISGANAIENKKQSVDRLNIFPVPDGDTGTNMSMTMSAARTELLKLEGNNSAGDVAAKAASALLRGARGNSGVILSLLFRGFSMGLKGVEEATGADLANALTLGVSAAYKAVMNPTEGTILTVARVAAEKGKEAAAVNASPNFVWDTIVTAADEALKTTPDLLPVLKRAGVVDAGGQGLLYVFKGMQSVFNSGAIVEAIASSEPSSENFSDVIAEFDEVINFTYCTEFIVGRENQNEPNELRMFLETIGDCVVVVDDEEIIKVHVHTDTPGHALNKALDFGSLLTVKIENMREQNKKAGDKGKKTKVERVEPVAGKIGFVAVAAGDGLCDLFTELGCDNVVTGGQTMNPSTQDILAMVQATPAETVVVLPNNKNIIMAAEQCIPIADRKVVVLPTRTIPQGISAMLACDPSAPVEQCCKEMHNAAAKVATGQITFAARDSEFGGKKIKEGDILCLSNGKLAMTEKDPVKAAVKLVRQMSSRSTSFITLIYGEGITEEQATVVQKHIEKRVPNAEVTLINGGQPVYYFIISVE